MLISWFRNRASILVSVLFFLSLFLYLWVRINPSFYGLVQTIAFQGTYRFFIEHLSYPGGIIDYSSAFLSVFFVYPIVGAIIITIVLALIAYASHLMLRLLFGPRTWYTLHLYPAVLCGALQSNYDHRFSVTVALCIALLAFALYGYQRFRRPLVRIALYCILGGAVYYCAGGAFLLFSLLCIMHETIVCRCWTVAVLYAAVAGAVPYLLQAHVFLIAIRDAYLYLLPFGDLGYTLPILPSVLYGFFPALFFIAPAITLFRKRAGFSGTTARVSGFINPLSRSLAAGGIFVAVTIAAFMLSFHRNDNTVLRYCSMSLQSRWSDILKQVGRSPSNMTLFSNFAVTQALFHTGSLPVDLFSFPQYFGVRGLFLCNDETGRYGKVEAFSFFYRGELAFKLGLVNSAQHWYYEALSSQGVTAAVLKRLSQIHALKGDLPAARTCLSILATMPMQRTWALRFRDRLEDRSFVSLDPELAGIERSMPKADFLLTDSRQPYHDCEEALQQHPTNRMTFEYCMSAYLLLCNVQKIASLIGYLDTLGYAGIPPLYEQALLMLKAGHYPLPEAVINRISQSMLDDFLVIDRLLYQFQGDLGAAKGAIQEKFQDSYWYYHFYVRPNLMRKQ